MRPEKVREYVDAIWIRYDIDKSNNLDFSEFYKFMKDVFKSTKIQPLSEAQVLQIFTSIDSDKDKLLTKDEVSSFVQRYFNNEVQKTQEEKVSQKIKKYVEKVWQACDFDKSGTLDEKEFSYFIKSLYKLSGDAFTYSEQETIKIYKQIDTNKDRKLSKQQVNQFVNKHFGKQIYKSSTVEEKPAVKNSKISVNRLQSQLKSRSMSKEDMKYLAQQLARQETPSQVKTELKTKADGSTVQVVYITYQKLMSPQDNKFGK